MKSSEHFTSHSRLSHSPVLLLFFLLLTPSASSQPKYSKWNAWLWMSPKRSIRIEIGFDIVIFTNNFKFTNYHYSFHLLSLPNPTPSNLPHISPFISLAFFFQQSNDKTQVLLFPLKVPCCFYVLNCIVHVSKSFKHHTPQIHFSIQFPSFLPKCIP